MTTWISSTTWSKSSITILESKLMKKFRLTKTSKLYITIHMYFLETVQDSLRTSFSLSEEQTVIQKEEKKIVPVTTGKPGAVQVTKMTTK